MLLGRLLYHHIHLTYLIRHCCQHVHPVSLHLLLLLLLSLHEPDIQPLCPLIDLMVVIDLLLLRLISLILVWQARTQLLVVRRPGLEEVQETLDKFR